MNFVYVHPGSVYLIYYFIPHFFTTLGGLWCLSISANFSHLIHLRRCWWFHCFHLRGRSLHDSQPLTKSFISKHHPNQRIFLFYTLGTIHFLASPLLAWLLLITALWKREVLFLEHLQKAGKSGFSFRQTSSFFHFWKSDKTKKTQILSYHRSLYLSLWMCLSLLCKRNLGKQANISSWLHQQWWKALSVFWAGILHVRSMQANASNP